MEKELMIYQSADEAVKVEALCEKDATWLTMAQMCELFGENELIIGGHLTSIYAEGELREADTVKRGAVNHYSLDAALAVGFRVRTKKGRQFRLWAMQKVREYILKDVVLE